MALAEPVDFRTVDLLTKQTDYRSLCRTALQIVREHCPAAECDFLEVFDGEGQLPTARPSAERLVVRRVPSGDEMPVKPDWLLAALHAPHSQDYVPYLAPADTGGDEHVYSLGTLAGVARLMVVRGRLPSPRSARMLRAVMTLCANCFGLLDKFERDPLTGLLNRQSFDYRFEDMLSRYRDNPRRIRVGSKPWLAIADIDYFKRINDSYGHLFGDEILLLFSRVMRQSFRFDDLLFRYGGEEFVVILNNTDANGASLALERFRHAVEMYDFPTLGGTIPKGGASGRVTVSLGWVGVYSHEMPISLLHKADRALYRAKDLGRNRAISYELEFGGDQPETSQADVELFEADTG